MFRTPNSTPYGSPMSRLATPPESPASPAAPPVSEASSTQSIRMLPDVFEQAPRCLFGSFQPTELPSQALQALRLQTPAPRPAAQLKTARWADEAESSASTTSPKMPKAPPGLLPPRRWKAGDTVWIRDDNGLHFPAVLMPRRSNQRKDVVTVRYPSGRTGPWPACSPRLTYRYET